MTPQEQQEFIQAIATAVRVRSTDTALSEEEIAAIRVMIRNQEIINKRNMQSIAFRQSIIEKSLGALVAAMIIGAGAWIVNWFFVHIYKP
jgi:hypothetical protein